MALEISKQNVIIAVKKGLSPHPLEESFFIFNIFIGIIALQWFLSFCCETKLKRESAIWIHISTYPLPIASPSHPPYPTPLGGHKAQS